MKSETINFHALSGLDKYHIGRRRRGTRASMLYLDTRDKEGEWSYQPLAAAKISQAVDFLRP